MSSRNTRRAQWPAVIAKKSGQWKPTEADWKRAVTDPIFKHICLLNQYANNLQMIVILGIVIDVFDDSDDRRDEMTFPLLSEVLDAIESKYKQFHGITPAKNGSEAWAKLKSSRMLYGPAKIDRAFEKRAERHVRSIVKFLSQLDEVAAYLKREEAKTA